MIQGHATLKLNKGARFGCTPREAAFDKGARRRQGSCVADGIKNLALLKLVVLFNVYTNVPCLVFFLEIKIG